MRSDLTTGNPILPWFTDEERRKLLSEVSAYKAICEEVDAKDLVKLLFRVLFLSELDFLFEFGF